MNSGLQPLGDKSLWIDSLRYKVGGFGKRELAGEFRMLKGLFDSQTLLRLSQMLTFWIGLSGVLGKDEWVFGPAGEKDRKSQTQITI